MKYPYLTLSECQKLGYDVQNQLIESIDLELIGHFGNIVTVSVIWGSGAGCGTTGRVFYGYNATLSCGRVLQCLFDLLDLSEENGKRLTDCRNIPARIVFKNGNPIGVGHFIKDKFVVGEDLFNIPGLTQTNVDIIGKKEA